MSENAGNGGNFGKQKMSDLERGLNSLKRHTGRIPEWQRKHLPKKPGRKAIAVGMSFLAPRGR